jgi:heptosyltransferase II
LLTHTWRRPDEFAEDRHHQLELWENFLRHFGLAAPLDRSPVALPRPTSEADRPVGLICGSENLPAKRWPVDHWRALIAALPDTRFTLLGTANDRPITAAVSAGFPPDRIQDLAGRTDFPAYLVELGRCRALVTNDTGGMHLANALGVPLLALFGPTNPVRTGPVFRSPARILQPPGCPLTGGGSLADLTAPAVVAALRELLASTPVVLTD